MSNLENLSNEVFSFLDKTLGHFHILKKVIFVPKKKVTLSKKFNNQSFMLQVRQCNLL